MSNRILTLLQQMVVSLIMIAAVTVAYQTLAAPNAQSSVPIVIPYQGKLSDSAGTAINSSVNITFRFYAAASGGSALWTETHSSVTVSNGLFRVMLGSVTAIPTTVWSNNPLYVGVQVGSEAEMTPREQIGAVPYSIVAGNALSVADNSITTAKLAPEAVETNYTLTLTTPTKTTSSAEAIFGTINLPVKSNVSIMSMWILENDNSALGMMARLKIDGLDYPVYADVVPFSSSGIGYTIARNHYIPNLAAGNHTFSVRIDQFPFRTGDAIQIYTISTMWIRAVPVKP